MKRNRVQVQKRLSPLASLRRCGTEGQCADTPAVDRWPQISTSRQRQPRPWLPADPVAVAMPMASLSVGGVLHGQDDLPSQQTAAGRLVPRHRLARPNSTRGVVLGTRTQGGREPEHCLEGQSQVVKGDQGTRRTDRPPRPRAGERRLLGSGCGAGRFGQDAVRRCVASGRGRPAGAHALPMRAELAEEDAGDGCGHLLPGTTVQSDVSACFWGVTAAGSGHQPIRAGAGSAVSRYPIWIG